MRDYPTFLHANKGADQPAHPLLHSEILPAIVFNLAFIREYQTLLYANKGADQPAHPLLHSEILPAIVFN